MGSKRSQYERGRTQHGRGEAKVRPGKKCWRRWALVALCALEGARDTTDSGDQRRASRALFWMPSSGRAVIFIGMSWVGEDGNSTEGTRRRAAALLLLLLLLLLMCYWMVE